MLKNVRCKHRWSHGTHQADGPILAKRVPAMHCRWLQQLPLFGPLVNPPFLKGEAHRSVLSLPPQKEMAGCKIWRPGRPGHENAIILPRPSNPSGCKTLFLVEQMLLVDLNDLSYMKRSKKIIAMTKSLMNLALK